MAAILSRERWVKAFRNCTLSGRAMRCVWRVENSIWCMCQCHTAMTCAIGSLPLQELVMPRDKEYNTLTYRRCIAGFHIKRSDMSDIVFWMYFIHIFKQFPISQNHENTVEHLFWASRENLPCDAGKHFSTVKLIHTNTYNGHSLLEGIGSERWIENQ